MESDSKAFSVPGFFSFNMRFHGVEWGGFLWVKEGDWIWFKEGMLLSWDAGSSPTGGLGVGVISKR